MITIQAIQTRFSLLAGSALCLVGLHRWAAWATREIDARVHVVDVYCERSRCGLIKSRVVKG